VKNAEPFLARPRDGCRWPVAGSLQPVAKGRKLPAPGCELRAWFQQFVYPLHDRECIGDVDDVGFASGPTAVGIERDGAALADKAPADDVRLFAVAAGGEALGVPRRRARLTDLVEMGEKGKDGAALAALVDERFRAAQRRARCAQEFQDDFARLRCVNLAVGLFFRPARSGNKQQLRFGTNRRLVECRRAIVRIPRAPALPPIAPDEEAEILLEARNLARRLQRIKGRAQNAQSAARLMAQVRAAISEERRTGTPEEEIEQLWQEVDRLTRERKRASEGPTFERAGPALPTPAPELDADEPEKDDERVAEVSPSYYVPYVPPEMTGPADADGEANGVPLESRSRPRPRPRA